MDFEADSAGFLRWLRERGGASISGKIALVDLRATGGGRGVVATANIEPDEDLFEIPRSIVLSVENSDLRKKIPDALDDLDSWLSLVVVMIYEYLKTPDTLWRPYFRVLPGHFDTLIFWSPAELAELQGSAVSEKIGKNEADKIFCEKIMPIVRNNPELFPYPPDVASYEEPSGQASLLAMAHTMATLVMAYGFDIEKDESQQQVDDEGFISDDEDDLPKGMVPLADMLNADAERNNARLFYNEDSLVMKSLAPIKKGEQLFNDYGPLPRSDLLRRYGYVTDRYASYDVVELSTNMIASVIAEGIGMSRADVDARLRRLADKFDLMDAHDLTHPGISQSCFPAELLVLIRSLISASGHSTLNVTGSDHPVSRITGDIADILRKVIVTRQGDYATTAAEDEALLQSTSIGGRRRRMAIDVRLGEKMILKEALEELEKLNISSTPSVHHSIDIDSTKRRAEQDGMHPSKKRKGA